MVGEGSVLDHDVEIENAVALPGAYLGPNTRINQAIAQGGILVDIHRACRIDINENFILGTIAKASRTNFGDGKGRRARPLGILLRSRNSGRDKCGRQKRSSTTRD